MMDTQLTKRVRISRFAYSEIIQDLTYDLVDLFEEKKTLFNFFYFHISDG